METYSSSQTSQQGGTSTDPRLTTVCRRLAPLVLALSFGACQTSGSSLATDPFKDVPQVAEHRSPSAVDPQNRDAVESVRTPPPAMIAPTLPPVAEPKILMMQPEYKPTYDSSDKTRLVHVPNPEPIRYPIQQVVYLAQEEGEPKDGAPVETTTISAEAVETTAPVPAKPAKLNDITIDPALAEQGAKIIAQHQNFPAAYQVPCDPAKTCCPPVPCCPSTNFSRRNEFLCDGGDQSGLIRVEEDWTVVNMQAEDTVAHFDTLDGRTVVEPSNKVCIYAPRFASVRKIEGALNSSQITALSRTDGQWALHVDRNKEQLGKTAQEVSTGYARTRDQLGGVSDRVKGAGADTKIVLSGYGAVEAPMLYTNWMMTKVIGSAELAYLAEGRVSARAWEGIEGVKVRINTLAPMSANSEQGAESFFQIEEDKSKTSKLRLIKVASKKAAQPGETVEFTFRFDNIGNQPIGNVTLLDNLTTRLEFVPGSAKCSVTSGFVVEPNDAGSFTLRFEITDPLEPGQFGVVQFQCRVR